MIVRRIIRADRTTLVFDQKLELEKIRALLGAEHVSVIFMKTGAAMVVELGTPKPLNQDANCLLKLADDGVAHMIRGDVAVIPAEDLKILEPA